MAPLDSHWSPHVKMLDISPNVRYAYVHIPPADASKPYLLFLHGFPETSWDWHHQITHFAALGYGVVAPDLLGYGATSAPLDLPAYRLGKMAAEVLAVLDAAMSSTVTTTTTTTTATEKQTSRQQQQQQRQQARPVIGISHDFGTILLSYMHATTPERFGGYAFCAVAYNPLAAKFDLDAANAAVTRALGYPAWGYFAFLGRDPDRAAALLDCDPTAATALFTGDAPGHWARHLRPLGATRSYLEESAHTDRSGDLPAWMLMKKKKKKAKTDHRNGEGAEEEEDDGATVMATRNEIIKRAGGYAAPLRWYAAVLSDVNDADVAAIARDRLMLDKPMVFIEGARDEGALPPGAQEAAKKPWVPTWTVETVDAGHWMMLENPDAVNEKLQAFIEGLDGQF